MMPSNARPSLQRSDALAALDLIRDEAAEEGQHLTISMVAALRNYLASTS
jgi:hypothetical protein